MFRFLLPAGLFAVGLPPTIIFAFEKGVIPTLPSFLYESTWVVAFVTTVLFIYLFRMGKPSLFVQLYLLSMVVKLLAAFVYSLLMIRLDPAGGAPNVLYFLGVYVVFTTLEIACLYRKISRSPQA